MDTPSRFSGPCGVNAAPCKCNPQLETKLKSESHRRTGESRKRGAKLEKRRRSGMRDLCTTLSYLVPQQHHHGRQCLVERLDEAAKYIVFLEEEIKQLEDKRASIQVSGRTDSNSGNGKLEFPRITLKRTGENHLQVIIDGVKQGIRMSSLLDCIESLAGPVVTADLISSEDLQFISIVYKVSGLEKTQENDLLYQIQKIVESTAIP